MGRAWRVALVLLLLAGSLRCAAPAALDSGLSDSGLSDSGLSDLGLSDSGLSDSGLSDSGLSDSGLSDSGLSDSGLSDSGLTDPGPPDGGVMIDFSPTSALFPPLVNKIGFNSFWDSASNDGNLDVWTMRRSAKYRAPMISGLVEPKTMTNVMGYQDHYDEYRGDTTPAQLEAQSSTLWEPGYTQGLFRDNGGTIEARTPTDPDLVALRDEATALGMINFLQLAGTPGTTFTGSSTYFNGLFTLTGTPTTGGNWYPLPKVADFPALAHAFGSLPDALGYATPTVFAFWQEPSHTIDESLNAADSIDRYVTFYWQVASALAKQCRWQRCPVAGAQLNANDGDSTPHDGSRYRWFLDGLRTKRANNPTVDIPLDAFTIQNYAAQWNDNIVKNARVALGTDFSFTPVLFNEWDYCVNSRAGDGCTAAVNRFDERYDGPQSVQALHWLWDTVENPDVSAVLLREKVLRDRDPTTGTSSYPWTQVPILFLASMSELRRPASTGFASVPMLATGDDDQVRIIAWNEGALTRTFPLALTHLPPSMVGKTLLVKKFGKAIRDARCPGPADVMDVNHDVTCWADAVAPAVIGATEHRTPPITLAPGEVLMVLAGAPPTFGSTTFSDHFVRAAPLVKRDGTAAAPAGLGHFDPRTGALVAAVAADGDALVKLTLRNVGDTLSLSTRFISRGTVNPAGTVAGLRVDYLDANHQAVKSVFFRDQRWTTAAAPWNRLEWPKTSAHLEVPFDFCGSGCATGSGAPVSLDLLASAPAGWSTTRDVVIGWVLTGTGTAAISRLDLP